MKEITFTVCDAGGRCGECDRVPERTYQFSLSGRGIVLCGQCLSTFVSQVQWMLNIAEPNLRVPTITLSADDPSELRCSKCLNLLATYITRYYCRR